MAYINDCIKYLKDNTIRLYVRIKAKTTENSWRQNMGKKYLNQYYQKNDAERKNLTRLAKVYLRDFHGKPIKKEYKPIRIQKNYIEISKNQKKINQEEYYIIKKLQKKIETYLEDLSTEGIGNDGGFDFVNPASLEFRGISELYNMVNGGLLFVVLFLFAHIIYTIFSSIRTYVENWDKFVEILKTEYRILDLYTIIIEEKVSNSEYSTFWNNKKKIKDFKEGEIFKKIINNKNSLEFSISKFSNIFLWIEGIFFSESFWVYYSKLEFIWTLIPCLILLFISIPSFTLALALDETHKPATWIKVIGNQWYWVYEYSTYSEDIVLYSNIKYGSDLNNNSLRVLEPDISITIVNNKFTRFLITSSDVIHCWAVPSLGIKIDACPGRINSISVLPTKVGVHYGQCSEICGVNHGFMPICVEVVA